MTQCPNCGSVGHHHFNLIDERPYREAAAEAEYLRHYGRIEEGKRKLAELSAVRIANYERLPWRCGCGASFRD